MTALLQNPLARSPLVWIVGIVAVQRLGELVIANFNTWRLMRLGAREVGRAHYPLFILLHGSWLIAIALTTPIDRQPNWPIVGALVFLQVMRAWAVQTLGPYWTTRVITIDDAPLIRRGPYRYLRHPNYWIVVAEIALLPLAFGDWAIAVIWSVLNAVLLRHRISIERAALSGRPVESR
jgi:methyltransferase